MTSTARPVIESGTVIRGLTAYPAERVVGGGMRMLIVGVWVGVTNPRIAETFVAEPRQEV